MTEPVYELKKNPINRLTAVLKRLDDSSDKVRLFATQTITTLFKNRPVPYDTVLYGAHVDALYSAMLIHLDDSDEAFRKEMLGMIMKLVLLYSSNLRHSLKPEVINYSLTI